MTTRTELDLASSSCFTGEIALPLRPYLISSADSCGAGGHEHERFRAGGLEPSTAPMEVRP
jgi:hypothetical protein